MHDLDETDLWILSQAGPFRFCGKGMWQSIYASVQDQGWSLFSESGAGWLVSPLSHYMPGSFFTAEDAKSFADIVSRRNGVQGYDAGQIPDTFLENLVDLFQRGAVFISEQPLENTLGTESVELIHVYLCPECGFLHHGRWREMLQGRDPSEIEASARAALKHKYCPLCSCTKIVWELFVLPQLDPEILPSCLQTTLSL